jgi:hypothetical protein
LSHVAARQDSKQLQAQRKLKMGAVMNNHRYQYLYLPIIRFMQQQSPNRKWLVISLKISVVVALVGFHLASSAGLL